MTSSNCVTMVGLNEARLVLLWCVKKFDLALEHGRKKLKENPVMY